MVRSPLDYFLYTSPYFRNTRSRWFNYIILGKGQNSAKLFTKSVYEEREGFVKIAYVTA